MRHSKSHLIRSIVNDTLEAARHRTAYAFDESIAGRRDRIVLFGCGSMGRRILARLRQDDIWPVAFADNNPSAWGTVVDGLTVLSPADAASKLGPTGVFVVTVYNPYSSFCEIYDQLVALGCARISSVVPVRWKYSESFLPYLRDDLPEKVIADMDTVLRVAELWQDEESSEVYVRQLHWRLFGDFHVLPPFTREAQYFPASLFSLGSHEYLVDCGAFDGDTIRAFLDSCQGSFDGVQAIEPDPESFERLRDYVVGLPSLQREKIRLHSVAVGSTNGVVRFTGDGGLESRIDAAGSADVPCLRLDDLLANQPVTQLKLDIEGSEPDALCGASRVLHDQHPRLSVCVYHAQDHLWRIPSWVSERFPDYRLALRSHAPDCWETILYAM